MASKRVNKTAAIEMSVGMIIVIILGVTLLVGGIIFVTNILKVANGVVGLTDTQLRNQINQLFSTDTKIAVYPDARFLTIKQEEVGNGVGLGIRNMLSGASSNALFSYQVAVSDTDIQTKCGISADVANQWIQTGRSEDNIAIASGDLAVRRIVFEIPVGSPLCTIRYGINIQANGANYGTDYFDIKVAPK